MQRHEILEGARSARGATKQELRNAIREAEIGGDGGKSDYINQTSRRPDLLTVAEAAKYLGVSAQWLRNKATDKTRPERYKIGRRVYYTKKILDEFIEQGRQKHT